MVSSEIKSLNVVEDPCVGHRLVAPVRHGNVINPVMSTQSGDISVRGVGGCRVRVAVGARRDVGSINVDWDFSRKVM